MGSPFSSCANVIEEYKEEKKQNKHLMDKDRRNNSNRDNEHYQYKSFMEDNSFLESQKWVNEKNQNQLLFHTEKLVSAYPDYQFDQEIMQKVWKRVLEQEANVKIDVNFSRELDKSICPNWKYLIRKGVPFDHMRRVILEMFKRTFESNDVHYQTVFQTAFKDRVPAVFKNVPTFTEKEHLPDMVKFHFLNEAGGEALKRLLWVIRKIELLEYSPLLAHVISFLLIFLTEAETFCVIQIMIEESKKILKHKPTSLKWHFTVMEEDHLKLSQSYFEKIRKKSLTGMKILSHFEKIGFDYTNFFQILSQNFFLEFLKISDIIKFFVAFLNEGIKIHFRIVYAIMKTLKKTILSINDKEELQKVIAIKCLSLSHSESHQLIKYAFQLSFSANECFSTTKIRPSKLHNLKTYYMPHIEEGSEFIGDEQFETIWEWLPSGYRISDPVLIFRTTKDGFHLPYLHARLSKYENKPMIILIKTSENIIFGAFSPEKLHLEKPNNFYGTNEIFLFQLSPKEIKFPSTNNNQNFIYSSKEYFSFGDGDKGPAFLINSDLTTGRSNVSSTFDNIAFRIKENDDRIFCTGIEIFLIN